MTPEEKRQRRLEWERLRMKDPEYRAKRHAQMRAAHKARYDSDPEFRAAVKKRVNVYNKKLYQQNEAFRRRQLERSRISSEKSVMRRLREMGLSSTIEVGVSGFHTVIHLLPVTTDSRTACGIPGHRVTRLTHDEPVSLDEVTCRVCRRSVPFKYFGLVGLE